MKLRKTIAWSAVPALNEASRWINKNLRTFADYLQARSGEFGKQKLMLFLTLFCLCFGSLSIATALNVFHQKTVGIQVQSITLPKYVIDMLDVNFQASQLPIHATARILQFQKHLDSLRVNEITKYDSLRLARPGLIDSLEVIERIISKSKNE